MSTKAQPLSASSSDRISFIDVLRGVAVVAMIWMHTADGWLERGYRQSQAWPRIASFGGLAAPLFFTLAGVGLGLTWAGTEAANFPRRLRSQLQRGLQLIVLGYALRVQMWMIDAGGYKRAIHWLTAVALITGYVILHRSLRPTAAHRRRWLAIAATLVIGSLIVVQQTEPTRIAGLLRVDVLQGLGASTVIVCALCLLAPALLRAPWTLIAIGLALPLAVNALRASLPGALPVPLAGYIAAWTPAPGTPSTTLFPLFPWMAYVFVGAAVALMWKRANGEGQRAIWIASFIGVVVAFASAEVQPWMHAVHRAWPDTVHVTRVVYRLAVAAALLTPALWLAPTRVGAGLRQLGTASLWIYWIHLELAFGSLARPIAHQLTLGPWLLGFVVLTALMIALAVAINTRVGAERLRNLAAMWRRSLRA